MKEAVQHQSIHPEGWQGKVLHEKRRRAAEDEALDSRPVGDAGEGPFDSTQLGLQAAAEDGVVSTAGESFMLTLGQGQPGGVAGQGPAHEIEAGQDKAAQEIPVRIQGIDGGSGAGADHQAIRLYPMASPH